MRHILARLFQYCCSGDCPDTDLVEIVTEYDGTVESIDADPSPFLNYLHLKCDLLDWFSIRETLALLCGKQLPRLFEERLEGATTIEQFDQVMGPYLELDHEQ